MIPREYGYYRLSPFGVLVRMWKSDSRFGGVNFEMIHEDGQRVDWFESGCVRENLEASEWEKITEQRFRDAINKCGAVFLDERDGFEWPGTPKPLPTFGDVVADVLKRPIPAEE